MSLGGNIPMSITFDAKGQMRIDATIYERAGKVAAVIKKSDFAVLNQAWDRNWDSNAFEVVDSHQHPMFRIDRPQWDVLNLRGVFITDQGAVIVVNDAGLVLNPTSPVGPPATLFKYPSGKYPQARVKQP
jgi:hypothetical protein